MPARASIPIVAVVGLFLVAVSAPSQQRNEPCSVGRYQVLNVAQPGYLNAVIRVDTTTGKTWSLNVAMGQNVAWVEVPEPKK